MTFKPVKKYVGLREMGTLVAPPIVLPSADWTNFLSGYTAQLYKWDTDGCTQFSGSETMATFCNQLKDNGSFSPEALAWFTVNGYFDANGSFAFSQRFTAILDGTSINGNVAQSYWSCIQKYGLLPRSDLDYTLAQSEQFATQQEQDNDYYNPAVITAAMYAKATAALQWFGIAWGWVNTDMASLQIALQTAPVQIVVPVPSPVELWNQQNVSYTGGIDLAHCVELYKIDPTSPYPYFIRDQYIPDGKQLQAGYYIGSAIQGIVIPVAPKTVGIPVQNEAVIPVKSFLPSWLSFILNHLKFW
jgi:hypothetical protein